MTDHADLARGAQPTRPAGRGSTPEGARAAREAVQRWRLVLGRDAPGPGRGGDQAAWEVALAGCGLPVAGLDLPAPRPRFAVAAPLPAGLPGEAELVDVWLTERVPRWRVREALERRLPDGHRLVDVYDAWLGEPALPGLVAASVYRAGLGIAGPSTEALRLAATAMLAADALPRRRARGDTTVGYDLRPLLDSLEVERVTTGAPLLRMTLRHDPEKGVGRPDEVLAELADRTGGPLPVETLVRERVVLRDRAPEPQSRPAPRGRVRREPGT